MIDVLVVIYLCAAVILTLYTSGGFILTLIYLFKRERTTTLKPLVEYPKITIQLPIYNESTVVENLLSAVSKLDYPKERLVIQVLDDSTDNTSQITARLVNKMSQDGFSIQHIRRKRREGYKAGALALGMEKSHTPYYAIFDADFIPSPNFIKKLLPYLLEDKDLGMVQGRWGHLNGFENSLTAAQVLAIDTHFIIEQTARSKAGLFLSFNGSGGIWRAACIRDAGGWQATTLTEDFDLSYRAQLKGWRLLSLTDVVTPAELPSQLSAFKQQQARWARGSTQCLLRFFLRLWTTPKITLGQRIMATLHLCQYMPYITLLTLTLLTPILILRGQFQNLQLGFLTFSGVVPPLMYVVSQMSIDRKGYQRLIAFPALILFGTGVALSNTFAVLATLFGRQIEFRRTPKHGESQKHIYSNYHGKMMYAELLMCAYGCWGTWIALQNVPSVAPYLALSAVSYGAVGLISFFESRQVLPVSDRKMRAAGD